MKNILIFLISIYSLNSFSSFKTFRGNYHNTGSVDLNLANAKVADHLVVKKFKTEGLIWASAVSDEDGNIFVGSADKSLYAFNEDFNLLWKYTISNNIGDSLIDSASALTRNGLVIIPGGDGKLHAVNKINGKREWVFSAAEVDDDTHQNGDIVNSFEGNVKIGPNGMIYAGSDNGYMYSLDLSGNLRFKFKTNMMIWSAACFFKKDQTMFFGSLDGFLYALNYKTGDLVTKFKIGSDVKSSPSCDENLSKVFVGSSSGKFYAFNFLNKKLKKQWVFNTKKEVYSSPAIKNEQIYFGSLNGNFYSLNYDGSLNFIYKTTSKISSSPLITKDNKVIFGAKNGKLYILNSTTGEREWSYKTNSENYGVNLDASPLLTENGLIINGSYDGNIFAIPSGFCINKESQKCEFAGTEDLPGSVDFNNEGVSFTYVDNMGNLFRPEDVTHPLSSPIKLKLNYIINKKYLSNAGLDSNSIKVLVNNKKAKAYVSSDNNYLNIIPDPTFKPSTKLMIKVKGRVFQKDTWLKDFKKEFGKKFKQEFFITTNNTNSFNAYKISKNNNIAIKSLLLFQPESLDTYIPAALDGQYFIMKTFSHNNEKKTFKSLVLPASFDGKEYTVLKAPKRTFLLNGLAKDNHLSFNGEFNLSAMGGEINFKEAQFNTYFKSEKQNIGELFLKTSCLSLQGNGSSYFFPMQLIDDTCDHLLRLIGLGSFKTDVISKKDSIRANLMNKFGKATFSFKEKLPKESLLIRYNSKKDEIEVSKHSKNIQYIDTNILFKSIKKDDVFFLDDRPIEL